MQNFCVKCGKAPEEVGKLIQGKCIFCRGDTLKNRNQALNHEITRLEGRLERLKRMVHEKRRSDIYGKN